VLVTKRTFILCAAFVVSVLFRLPNINRPLSKHHEFAVAVILNGIISWKESGGASVFHYVPLMTYQGEENRLLERGVFTDAAGNQVYLSLGPGWYVLPYVVFTILHLPFTPLSLQLLNLVIHFITLLALYRLGLVLVKHYSFLSPYFPLLGCLVFLFMPGPLWYFGNGYVHAAVSLPFAISLFTQYLKWTFEQSRLSWANAGWFFLCGFGGIYLDWFTFFLLAVLGMAALFFYIKKKEVNWLLIAGLIGTTAFASVAIIFWQFASLLGWHNVAQYWTERSGDRSLTNEGNSMLSNVVSFIVNMVTCAGAALLVAGISIIFLILRKSKNYPTVPLMLWIITCLLYNGIFFNWSYVHEFSMVPLCVGISLLAAHLLQAAKPRTALISLVALIVISLAQYYQINPPGAVSRVGTPYAAQMHLGKKIDSLVPKGYRIFSNLGNDPMVEYYAHRSFGFFTIEDAAAAQHLCDSFRIRKAVWLDVDSLQLKGVHWLK
jgi:hypothetical protein